MSVYTEKEIHPAVGILILFVLLAGLAIPALLESRELLDRECEFAIIARNISWSKPWCTLYGELLPNHYPLYALFSHTLIEWGVPLREALRLTAFAPLLGLVIMVFAVATDAAKRLTSGFVAAAAVLTCVTVIDRALWASPDYWSIFFIFVGWITLFNLGVAKNRWYVAWGLTTLWMLGMFFSGGLSALILFLVPLWFEVRPFSGLTRMRKPPALLAYAVVVTIAAAWAYNCPYTAAQDELRLTSLFILHPYSPLRWLIAPFDVFIRLLPWTLILFPAFCPAYRIFDSNPIFSRYTRTLSTTSMILLMLLPCYALSDDGKILIPLLGVLVSTHYVILMRRHGETLLHLLRGLFALILFVSSALLAVYIALPHAGELLKGLSRSDVPALHALMTYFETLWVPFNALEAFQTINGVLVAIAMLLSILFITPLRRRIPIWTHLAMLMLTLSLLHLTFVMPRRALQHDRERLAEQFAAAVKNLDYSPANGALLYRLPSSPKLYAEMAYLGWKVQTVGSFNELSNSHDDTLFVLTGDIPPPLEGFKWNEKELIKAPYSANKNTAYMWVGTRINTPAAAPLIEDEPTSLIP